MTATGDARAARALNVYIGGVVCAGATVLLASAWRVSSTPRPAWWLTLTALALLTGSFRLRFASISADIAIDDTFYIAIALLFGPGPAALTIGAGGFLISYRRRRPARQIAFNTAAFALSMWSAAEVFFLITGAQPLSLSPTSIAPFVLPVLALATVYFLLNSGLTAVAIGLDTRQSPLTVWHQHFRWVSIGYLGAASVSFCLILLIQLASLMALVLVVPLLAIFHLTLRSSFGRVEDANRHLADMDRLYLSTVETLAMAIDAKDDVTHSHVRRVQAYATALARVIGVSDEPTLKAIEAAALLHDTGKLAIPEHILNKPGKLTEAEFEKMKLHADIGADILSLVQFPFPVEPIVRCHHENWDGSGYPRGIAGDAIPIGARILSVVDCFDALTSDRPYRRRLPDEEAIAILRQRRGTMYDPAIVDAFIATFRDVQIGVEETPEQRDVLQRISATKRDAEATAPPPATAAGSFGMTSDLLAFVSLARLTSGEAGAADVLALASKLVGDIVPGVTGAWYLPEERNSRLTVATAFGPAATAVSDMSVGVGDRLTGWVAATRQVMLDSDAALDLGVRTDAEAAALRRCMSVPLLVGNTLVAVLTLYAPDASALTADRARLLQVVAPHLAAAIEAASARPQQRAADARDRAVAATRDLRLVSTR
jgi:putative nucleotidyltransferase with HDIG domain